MNEIPFTPILTFSTIAALILLVEHYAVLIYTRLLSGNPLPVLPRYVIGTLAMNGTLTVFFFLQPSLTPLGAAASVILITSLSGLAVFLAYGLDWCFEGLAQRREARELSA
jgi:hypothetical protein